MDIIQEILAFVKKCDNDIQNDIYSEENAIQAVKYLKILRAMKEKEKSSIIRNLINKLQFITNQIDTFNFTSFKKASILNLVSLSVTDYIITLVKEKRITDPLLIARFVYIELSKVLYYDISYVKQQTEEGKEKMWGASVDLKKEKIFSYVVCTQWLQLYTYILKYFDIDVIKRSRPGQYHVWGEIKLNSGKIVIVDATDYIDSSIDLSNAKSMSPTVGFVILPSSFSGINLYDTFNDRQRVEEAKIIRSCYDLNRDLDMSLGYITKKGYKVENIIKENEIFNYSERFIKDSNEIRRFTEQTIEFFKKLKIPNNIDGYEIFAYYSKFLRRLPANIAANISQQTIYVDSYAYKHQKMKEFLHAPNEYLRYLDGLIYSRYYKYLEEPDKDSILGKVKRGELTGQQIRDMIVKYEMQIAEVNRRLNFFYAINKLQFYDPLTCDTLGIQLYEPMIGKKTFKTDDQLDAYKNLILVK